MANLYPPYKRKRKAGRSFTTMWIRACQHRNVPIVYQGRRHCIVCGKPYVVLEPGYFCSVVLPGKTDEHREDSTNEH